MDWLPHNPNTFAVAPSLSSLMKLNWLPSPNTIYSNPFCPQSIKMDWLPPAVVPSLSSLINEIELVTSVTL
jgi:hypothetical protein